MLKLKSYIQKVLEEISWRTLQWNFKYSGSELLLNEGGSTWGLKVCVFTINYREYALLSFESRLPNKTSVRKFTVDHWDVLFLRNWLWKMYEDLSERELWSSNLSTRETIKLRILDKLFN